MNTQEETLLAGALKLPSHRVLLVHGMASSETEILNVLSSLRGKIESLDLRVRGTATTESLRDDLTNLLKQAGTVVVFLASSLSESAVEVFNELKRGQLAENVEVGAEQRLVAIHSGEAKEEISRCFELVVAGKLVLDRLDGERKKRQDKLEAARSRARESSRQHGLEPGNG